MAYTYQPPNQLDDVYVQDSGGGDTPIITTPTDWEHPAAWSHDRANPSLLVARMVNNEAPVELDVWSFTSKTLTLFVKPAGDEAAFSPDDRYVAFSSQESGRFETYVTTFPERQQTWPLTTDGGRVLSWSAKGDEILVATLAGHIAAYPVSTEGGRFVPGQPQVLVRDVGLTARYSRATPDHSRILVRVSPEAAKDRGEIRLLFGWDRH